VTPAARSSELSVLAIACDAVCAGASRTEISTEATEIEAASASMTTSIICFIGIQSQRAVRRKACRNR
jgi:hypothetical protein